jgi:Ca-activated chloride channel family protein
MQLPRPIKNSLLPLLLVFAAQKVCAQLAPADDFFNSGAQFYISNNIPSALEKVESGLKIYPDDQKLKKLEELLKQQSQQQQQQNNQQSQQQKSDSRQDPQQKNSQDQQKQNDQNKSGQKKDEQEKQQEQQKASAQKQDKQDGEGQPVAPGQMTPEEAKRLLDAQKGGEQFLQLKPPEKSNPNHQAVKDW